MTLRLILTRHAKSSWDDPLMTDHDRPLNDRGRAAATDLGRWLTSRGYLPEQVLCSDAQRTWETWTRISEELPSTPKLDLKPTLYQAGADVMLAVLRHATAPVVMMIGHNPGIAEFAQRISARAPAHDGFSRYPTGATLVVEFASDSWDKVSWGDGSPDDFIVPRELTE